MAIKRTIDYTPMWGTIEVYHKQIHIKLYSLAYTNTMSISSILGITQEANQHTQFLLFK